MLVRDVRSHGLVGRLFSADGTPRPGVLALGGSEGGHPVYMAGLLADAGFTSLALQYFGGTGLPRHLVEVPLDYVGAAIAWLRDQPEVSDAGIGVIGSSKGAELALLAAALLPEPITAVVAYAPSAVAFAGIAIAGAGRRRSSWSFRGAPVPFVPYARGVRPSLGLRGLSLAPIYRAALGNAAGVAAAAIPIERSNASLLLISGDRDRMWPSSTMAGMLATRLAEVGKSDRVRQVRFSDAGHSFMPWAPDIRSEFVGRVFNGFRLAGCGGVFDLGGQPQANRNALREAWPQVTAFLAQSIS
jgi:dienelactone hydrolase